MKNQKFSIAMLTLTISLFVCSAVSQTQPKTAAPVKPATTTTTTQNVPAEYQAGIAQMRVAKGYLEKAGDKWGGYRVKGIQSIDQAFKALGVSPESTPSEMQSGNVDEPSIYNNGINALQNAKADFAKAGDDWGGRKAKGLALINQALTDLQAGINWAKQNKTY